MKLRILPKALNGTLTPIPSKSLAHRAILCAALSNGESRVAPIELSDDIEATLAAVKELGWAKVSLENGVANIQGGKVRRRTCMVRCRASGSTLRFLLPLALDGRGPVTFLGEDRLLSRPLAPYRAICEAQGIRWDQTDQALTVDGLLKADVFGLPGDISSQFFTGLLLALPHLARPSRIRWTGTLESATYIDLTCDMLAKFGVHVARTADYIDISGGQTYSVTDVTVEGDWSHAAFYLTAGALGGDVLLRGLTMDSHQGDRAMVDFVRRMGVQVEDGAEGIRVHGRAAEGITADVSQTPDIVPALAVAACAARGETRLLGASRLRMKESDRLEAMHEGLSRLGAQVEVLPDGLIIHGTGRLRGGEVDSFRDHRIAMALAMAAAICEEPMLLSGAECVKKSAPSFWAEYRMMGGVAHECDLGPDVEADDIR